MKIHWLVLLACLSPMLGCGNEAVDKMSTSSGSAPWPGLEAFETGPLMSVGYPKDMGAWGEVKKALAAESFATALKDFEQSELPEEYSDKQAQKDATIKAWQEAIEAGKSGPQDELKSKVEAAMSSMNSLRN